MGEDQNIEYKQSWRDDKLMLWNEGRLPEDFTMDMFLGKHPSRPYNKNVANIFFKAGFIESWGRGISKIVNGFVSRGMEIPTFEFSMGGLWVIIKRNMALTPQVTPQVTPKVTPKVEYPVLETILEVRADVDEMVSLFNEKEECSLLEIMQVWGLKNRKYVRVTYIVPMIEAGILKLKYPNAPQHPKQRYLLNELK